MEKYGKICCFSGWLRPDSGNTTQAATAGLGSKMVNKTTSLGQPTEFQKNNFTANSTGDTDCVQE